MRSRIGKIRWKNLSLTKHFEKLACCIFIKAHHISVSSAVETPVPLE